MKIFKRKGIEFAYAKGAIYCLEPVCLDIETSNNHAEKPEDLRCWIVSIQVLFNGQYHFFRYPEELVKWYEEQYKELRLYPSQKFKKKLITFIHNASYDLSYLIPYLDQLPDFGYSNQGIIESPNKFLTYIRGSLEFRCSYQLSGMSLYKWSKEMGIEHKKQLGLYDYDAVLYPDSELNENSKKYDLYDVLSMKECLDKQLEYHKDNLISIPYTSTGYIRRTLRRSCNNDKYYRNEYFFNNRLNPELYDYMLKSYAGGMTHNNRYYRDMVIRTGKTYEYTEGIKIRVKNIGHRDFKSHYPTQMTCYTFPLGVPQLIYKSDMGFYMTIGEILGYYPKFSSMSVIRFYKAKLKDKRISMPFMQFSKCYEASFDFKLLDNGRILNAEGEWIMYIDNLTLQILSEQYDLEYEVLEVYRMLNKPLPACMISVIDKYFKGKSDKKNLVHNLTEQFGKLDPKTIEAEFELMQDKKGLNSIYGCTATNPLREEYELDEHYGFILTQSYKDLESIAEGLNRYYKGRNNFLAYQVGVWVTARARYELYEYIKAIGYEKCLYCDTDSIFYIKDKETEKAIEALNAEKRKTAHYVTLDNGKKEYYDEFSPEPDCRAFKGLHAKCYGVVTSKGLELTIAGVPARTLIDMNDKGEPVYFTREEELRGKVKNDIRALNRLKHGFKFKVNAGVSAIYIGAEGYQTARKPTIMYIDGHEVHTAGGCVIRQLESKVVKDMDFNIKLNKDFEDSFDTDSIN